MKNQDDFLLWVLADRIRQVSEWSRRSGLSMAPARKYNADQPRWPAGTPVDPETGAGGGRFRPTGADGAGAGGEEGAGDGESSPDFDPYDVDDLEAAVAILRDPSWTREGVARRADKIMALASRMLRHGDVFEGVDPAAYAGLFDTMDIAEIGLYHSRDIDGPAWLTLSSLWPSVFGQDNVDRFADAFMGAYQDQMPPDYSAAMRNMLAFLGPDGFADERIPARVLADPRALLSTAALITDMNVPAQILEISDPDNWRYEIVDAAHVVAREMSPDSFGKFLGRLGELNDNQAWEWMRPIASVMARDREKAEFLPALPEPLRDRVYNDSSAETIMLLVHNDRDLLERAFGRNTEQFLEDHSDTAINVLDRLLEHGWISEDDANRMQAEYNADAGPIPVEPIAEVLGSTGLSVKNLSSGGNGAFALIDPESGETVGSVGYHPVNRNQIYIDLVVLPSGKQHSGLGRRLMDTLEREARKSGISAILFEADITIGRYAWAKMGYDYANPQMARLASRQFARWASDRGIPMPPEGWPEFESAYEVATYDIPGVVLYGRDLTPPSGDAEWVPPDMPLHVGKAFMLDRSGHGNWNAVKWLE